MNQQEWLQWRRAGIGSSDAGIIMGVSPWRTPYELWNDKVYGSSQEQNSSMKRGNELEPVARSWFENTMNVCLFPKNKIHETHEWVRASLDGMDIEETMAVEFKCPNQADHLVALNKKIPEKYIPQVQHQLLVTGLPGMYYCSFDGQDGVIVEVARDDSYIESMFSEEKKFWDMVNSKTPPALTERDFIPMDTNQEWIKLCSKWRKAKRLADRTKEKEQEIRDQMLMLCKGRNAQGNGLKISRSRVEGHVNWAKLRQDYPDVPIDQYRKNSYDKWSIRDIQESD